MKMMQFMYYLHATSMQEFKSQCFGGEFTGEVYDHVLKK